MLNYLIYDFSSLCYFSVFMIHFDRNFPAESIGGIFLYAQPFKN